jgi:tyrosine-protein phosphatase SIW14
VKAAWLALLVVCISAPAQLRDISAPAQLRDFYRIDDHIYRGRQPRKAGFEELARMGFKTVLDLRGGPIHKPHERDVVKATGMDYISIRLSGIFPPRNEQIASIVAVLEDPARWPIFVHCRRGDDRVGLAIACYRMIHDHWTNQQALDEARSYGISPLEVLMRRYIRTFDPSKVTVPPPANPEPLNPVAGAKAVR